MHPLPSPVIYRSRISRSGQKLGSGMTATATWAAAVAMVLAVGSAAAQERSAPPGNHKHEDVETEFIFGFTEGSSIHAPGEPDLKLDSIGEFGKRGAYRIRRGR